MTTASLGLILVGAGESRRMKGIDKVWATLVDKPLLWYSLSRLSPHADFTVLVVREGEVARAQEIACHFKNTVVVSGGLQRSQSVSNGLAALTSTTLVAIHDVARPLVPPRLLTCGAALAAEHGSAVPVLTLSDTIKLVGADDSSVTTLDRKCLRAAQTPQVFTRHNLLAAHTKKREGSAEATDDAGYIEATGGVVTTFTGSPINFKVTTEYDLTIARLLLESGACSCFE
ncbi:MAG: 2-C-methyl-D-erythritol 4-phosphate cytidylyltransferase [Chloroflexota bacterium]